ncbi:MAG: general secretion pathway protein GspB [Burkholderiaceae bacterium]
MSYILDALRRADAERERGSVPGIHAQPAMLGEADTETSRPARRSLWLGAGFGLVLLALLAWWFVGHDVPRPVAEPMAATPMPITPAPLPPVLAAPAPLTAPVPAVVAAPAPKSVPTTAPAPVAEAPRKPPPKVTATAAAKPKAAASKPAARAVAPPSSAPAPTAAEARVYALSELPDDIRRELPTLAVGGAMYSQNPANRMLIVNGQTFHEGDKLAPGLSLEQIKLKSAVLEYKGYRYGITY